MIPRQSCELISRNGFLVEKAREEEPQEVRAETTNFGLRREVAAVDPVDAPYIAVRGKQLFGDFVVAAIIHQIRSLLCWGAWGADGRLSRGEGLKKASDGGGGRQGTVLALGYLAF